MKTSSELGIELPGALLPSGGSHMTCSQGLRKNNPGRNQILEPMNLWKKDLNPVL